MTAPVKPVTDSPPEDEPVTGTFNPDDYDWPKHLKAALADIETKARKIDNDWKYYNGEHPKVWLTDAIRDKLDSELVTNMAENWCDVAVDAPIKRLRTDGFISEDDHAISVEAADNIFYDNDLWAAQKDLYTAARCCGEAFLFVWKDDSKEYGIDITVNDARHVSWPDDAHRSDPARVVKVWGDEDEGVWRATCYYKYVVVRLVGPKLRLDNVMPQARWFAPDPNDPGGPHGFERVPVVRFSVFKQRRSLIERIQTLQDKINKLSANLLVSAEFAAFRKTIVMTQQTIADDDLKFRPNRVLVLDPGGGTDGPAPTSVWESSPTDLEIYDRAIDRLIDKLFTKADLPGHMKVKSEKVAPSGAAYEADEGPFTEAIEDMQDAYGESWVDLFKLLGIEVKCQWRNPHVKSDKDEADTVKVYKDAGMPISLALKYYAGWDQNQLKELEEAPLSPQEQQALAVTTALATGMGGNPDDPTNTPSGSPQPPSNNGGTSGQPPKGIRPGTQS